MKAAKVTRRGSDPQIPDKIGLYLLEIIKDTMIGIIHRFETLHVLHISFLAAIITVLFEHGHINDEGRSHQNSLLFGRNSGWKGKMVGILLGTTFVFPPGPQHIDH